MRAEITSTKVLTEQDRQDALGVFQEVYLQEKNWINDLQSEIPEDYQTNEKFSWFLVRVEGEPAGVIRMAYDPPLELPTDFESKLDQDIDLDAVARLCRFVEVGRFMIKDKYRRNMRVAIHLMLAGITEVAERGYTHFITDVFENDPHSPLQFHTRVLGFQRIGTHRYGELHCNSVRIILVLDIVRSYHRLKSKKNKMFRDMTKTLRERLEALKPVSLPLFS